VLDPSAVLEVPAQDTEEKQPGEESRAGEILEGAIRFAINSHICQD